MKMLKLLLILTGLCGGIYPAIVTVIGQGLFPEKASGSVLKADSQVIGSELIAQKFMSAGFFHSRPSASDYQTVASGASQSGPTQKSGRIKRNELREKFPDADSDAWTFSGSGLDPHISPKTALAQLNRVSAARRLNPEEVLKLVHAHTEGATMGIWGQPRVNVLKLNMALMDAGTNGDTR